MGNLLHEDFGEANRIDWEYVYKWCDEHGTRGLLDTIRASIPPI